MCMKYLSNDESYCLGMSLTIEALKHRPESLVEVYLSSKALKNEQFEILKSLCKEKGIETIEDDRVIEKYSLKENCYCIGFFRKFYSDLKTDRHIVLYEFSDYGQLGTVLRSAVSFDFNDIVLINTDIDYFDPRSIRSSMGAIFHVNIKKYRTLDEYFDEYNYNRYVILDSAEKELQELIPEAPYTIIIPNDETRLNEYYADGYYLKHREGALPLSALASITFNYCFEKRRR